MTPSVFDYLFTLNQNLIKSIFYYNTKQCQTFQSSLVAWTQQSGDCKCQTSQKVKTYWAAIFGKKLKTYIKTANFPKKYVNFRFQTLEINYSAYITR